jgi:hypothetical protein
MQRFYTCDMCGAFEEFYDFSERENQWIGVFQMVIHPESNRPVRRYLEICPECKEKENAGFPSQAGS